MFGFLIGFASLAGLIVMLKRSRRRCGSGWHEEWHERDERHGWRRTGRRGWMRWLSRRLDTTAGQEREIAAAVDELFGKARELRREGQTTRQDVARVLREDDLDENALGELFARHDDALRETQKAFAGALGRIHAALDSDQRAKLAELIARGRAFGGGGPYRD